MSIPVHSVHSSHDRWGVPASRSTARSLIDGQTRRSSCQKKNRNNSKHEQEQKRNQRTIMAPKKITVVDAIGANKELLGSEDG